MASKGKPLSDRQQRFVKEYLKDCNAAAAYQRAGYKAKSPQVAAANAARLIANDSIAEAIAAGRAKQSEAAEVEAVAVLRELAMLGFSDVGDILDFSGTEPRLRPACEIPESARRAIASFKVKRYTEGHGDDACEVEVTEFKLWDKNSAIDKLLKVLGKYAPVKVAPTTPDGKESYGDIEAVLERLAQIARPKPKERGPGDLLSPAALGAPASAEQAVGAADR